MTGAPNLRIDVSLHRGEFTLKVDLALPANGITVLFGPSGSGKTTVLRCVAGLEKAHGLIALGNQTWQDTARSLFKPTWQREIGYVFQEASLFEHLNVRQNLHFGLRRAGKTSPLHGLDASLDLLGIGHLLDRTVNSLSGGERQRVAIARALATQPQLLLLDEPLASLDVARRKEVLPWLERLHDELKIPVLYVTHSVDELARLADHVVMLEGGTVRSCAPITEAMVSPEVALAIGEEAGLVTTGVILHRSPEDHIAQIQLGGGTLWVRDQGIAVGQSVRVRVLARDVSLARSVHEDSTIQNRLQGVIESIDPDVHPSQAIVRVRCGSERILGRVTFRSLRNLELRPGDPVWCQVKSVALIV
jgi:molybdate transport system ATP-binding protein